MSRLRLIRFWTAPLAFALGLAVLVSVAPGSWAAGVGSSGADQGTGPASPPPPSNSGDPDSPTNTGKGGSPSTANSGAISGGSGPVVVTTPRVGGGSWMLYFKFGLLALRQVCLRD